jgi:hypothetical protein
MTSGVGLPVYGNLYRWLYWYRDHYEVIEPVIILTELVLISYGLQHEWQTDIRDHFAVRQLYDLGFIKDHFNNFGDFFIFVILGISAVSRLLIALRGNALGYAYTKIGRIVDFSGNLDIDDVYARVKSAPWGSPPGPGGDKSSLLAYAEAIAARTSALLSVRTFRLPDKEWLARERDSLVEWFEAFPAALWRLVPEAKAGGPTPQTSSERAGYYSVIVPTTLASARAIRRGQKATDLAEVNHNVADVFAGKPLDASSLGVVEFVAYLQLHIPRDAKDQLAEELLFAASLQHVAYLLYRLYGVKGDFRAKWSFVIQCEAANTRHGRVLKRLGFVELQHRAHERSDAPLRPGKSYAGFRLFEIQVVGGQPFGDSDEADARKFINLIEELAIHYRSNSETPPPQ